MGWTIPRPVLQAGRPCLLFHQFKAQYASGADYQGHGSSTAVKYVLNSELCIRKFEVIRVDVLVSVAQRGDGRLQSIGPIMKHVSRCHAKPGYLPTHGQDRACQCSWTRAPSHASPAMLSAQGARCGGCYSNLAKNQIVDKCDAVLGLD